MTQNAVDYTIDPSGDQLMDTLLTGEQQNNRSSNSGSSRPAYAVAGMQWLNTTTTPWVLNMFDGTDDIAIGTVNATTNVFTPSNNAALATNAVTTTSITANAVTNAKLDVMAANTAKVNATTGSAAPTDLAFAASTIFARLAAGNIVAATVAQIKTLLAIAYADVSGLGTAAQATTGTSGATVPLLNAANTYSAAQTGAVTALTSTSNHIAINMALSNNFSHTFTENTTLDNPSNPVAGTSGCIYFTQHASSPKTLAVGTQYKWAGGVAGIISATNSAADTLYWNCRDTTHIELSLTKGNA